MSDRNKSYRIRTNVGEDEVLNVNLTQDFGILEVLSLKIDADNLYKYHTSNYGCVAGRVLANGNVGIPNAKISIFIAVDPVDSEDDVISYLYPYKMATSKNADGIRYNLLSEEQLSDCHRNVGTFPSKRTVLDDNNVIEVFDKYYKFTTRTNEAGDYMIFGVPVGSQMLHVDIDLSDIGILSQRPRDMVYKGYNITSFENANMFKKGTNLDNLAQIFSQNQSVYVYPFWGEETEGQIAITRRDIDIQYDFTPTCVFLGSLVSDGKSNGISKRCIPSERMGKMDNLSTGSGTIEMIRKTPNGGVEECIVQGNQLIDGNGTWCYQIPMNLDYVRTDEYGNIVPTDDPKRGIPTRARVRFRFSLTEFEKDNEYSHVSKVLVPNNPQYFSEGERNTAIENEVEGAESASIVDYAFGSETDENSFKDLFWNDVYTVKSFIPRIQMLSLDRNKRFSGFKAVNVNDDRNPIPYNNMRVDLTFMFTLQCAVFRVLLWVVGAVNALASAIASWSFSSFKISASGMFFKLGGRCVYIGDGYCEQLEGWYFAPRCKGSKILQTTQKYIRSGGSDNDTHSIDYQNEDKSNGGRTCLTNKIDYFVQCVEMNLATMYDVVQFDFYNDWLNGAIYMPRWFADIRRKRTYLFGIVNIEPKVRGCLENSFKHMFSRRYVQQCALEYKLPDVEGARNYTEVTTPLGCKNNTKQKCHKSKGRRDRRILKNTKNGGGLIHPENTIENKTVYYFRPCEWVNNGTAKAKKQSSYDTKCNLFATDIVLLGSLEENNLQGIPQTFKKLSSTSYQMPDAIVSTNVGVDGYLYGTADGTVCSGVLDDEGATQMPNTFESVMTWTEGKDEYESNPYDEEEYPVTEVAGIDWGYSGPNQGENDLSKLYFPGGHFLGISCFNSQTNIKSCVNLSRICEFGSMMSQRRAIINKNENDAYSYTYSYVIPTGLISGDDINDYGFKNEFATLNFNGLRTKRNEETAMLEYDFESIYPINFNGELEKYTQGEPYNLNGYKSDNPTRFGTDDAKAYVRTIEENSDDYYRFRFNLHGDYTADDAKKKFLLANSLKVSLPVYENSFYFYFGLKEGSTAIDRFYKEFFAECPVFKDYSPSVSVDVVPSDYCEDNGTATITVKNIEEPFYRVKLGDEAVTDLTPFSGLTAEIDGLIGDQEYTVEIYGSNIAMISKPVTTGKLYPETFGNIQISLEPYTREYEDLERNVEGVGHIAFVQDVFDDDDLIAVAVVTDRVVDENTDKPYAAIVYNSGARMDSSIGDSYAADSITARTSNLVGDYTLSNSAETVTVEGGRFNAWAGNVEYAVVAYYDCSGRTVMTELSVDTMTMPADLDIVFSEFKYASYRYLIKPLLEHFTDCKTDILKKWYNIILAPEVVVIGVYDGSDFKDYLMTTKAFAGHENRMKKVEYYLKKALFYQDSQCSSYGNGSIDYEILYGTPPYNIRLSGYAERLDDDGENSLLEMKEFNSQEEAIRGGYDLSTDTFICPTQDEPVYQSTGYFNDYRRVENKEKDYFLFVTDAAGDRIEKMALPSIYRPFFFRAIYYDYYPTGNMKFYLAIANGITENGEYKATALCGNDEGVANIDLTNTEREYTGPISAQFAHGTVSADYRLECSYKTTYLSNGTLSKTLDGRYGVTVSEVGDNPITLRKRVNVHFIGDGDGYYDSRVRYFNIGGDNPIELQKRENGMLNLKPVNWVGDKPYIEYKSYSPIDKNNGGYAWGPLMAAWFRNVYSTESVNNEITPEEFQDRVFEGDLGPVNREGYVVGIYDSDFNDDQENNYNFVKTFGRKNKKKYNEELLPYSMREKHTSELSIIRIYPASVFRDIISKQFLSNT